MGNYWLDLAELHEKQTAKYQEELKKEDHLDVCSGVAADFTRGILTIPRRNDRTHEWNVSIGRVRTNLGLESNLFDITIRPTIDRVIVPENNAQILNIVESANPLAITFRPESGGIWFFRNVVVTSMASVGVFRLHADIFDRR